MKRNNKDRFNKFRRGHHHYHITNISDVNNSVILAHNNGDNTASVCIGEQFTEQEAEMLRLFRSFDMRRKTEAMACLFKIEDNMKGVDNLG